MRELYRNRPRVFVSGHYGNFELAGYTLGLFGFPTFTVARTLDNPYLDRFVNHFRALKGQYILPKRGSAQEAAALFEGRGTLGVLADQHAGPKGCWVNFFGRPASTHKAIAVFALTNERHSWSAMHAGLIGQCSTKWAWTQWLIRKQWIRRSTT